MSEIIKICKDVYFENQYNEDKYDLPSNLSLADYNTIIVNGSSADGNTAVKFYNANGQEAFVMWNNKCSNATDWYYGLRAEDKNQTIKTIGIMSQDTGKYSATINSVTFKQMDKYEIAMKIMEERCGSGKGEGFERDEVIALATIANSPNSAGNPRPAVRMVCAYYEEGIFYVSTGASKNKMLQIEKNNEVSVAGLGWYSFQGIAENLGWVKDEKNAEIRTKFKKYFGWFEEVGNEDSPDSIVLRITLTTGTIIDNEKKYGEHQYEVDFVNKTVK